MFIKEDVLQIIVKENVEALDLLQIFSMEVLVMLIKLNVGQSHGQDRRHLGFEGK